MHIIENKVAVIVLYSGATIYALFHYFALLVGSRMGSYIDTNSALHAFMLFVAALVILLQFSRRYRIYGWAALPVLSLTMNHLFNAEPFIVPGFIGEIFIAGIMTLAALRFTQTMQKFEADRP